jgi:hypothetical protein
MDDQATDIERRVAAHDQILQALIAYLVESDTKILEHMREALSQPVKIGPDAFTDSAAYAARFVREVIRRDVARFPAASPSPTALWDDLWPTSGEDQLLNENVPVRFEILQRDDMWEVLRNGKLCGGYISRKNALEAAHNAIHDIFCNGGSAELIASQPRVRT